MPFEKNTVVWASAGTGKTRKLVDTYVQLIDAGVDPLHIVAITFTEKAAAEMRHRIRCAVNSPKVIAALPAAPISTIHGFCARLLKENASRLGLDPEFSILTEQRSMDLARESVIEVLRTQIRAGHDGISALFGDFGLERLVEAVVSAVYWLNSLGKNATWLDECVALQDQAAEAASENLVEYFNKYGRDFEKIGIAADELDAKRAKHSLKKRDDPEAVLPRIGQVAGVQTARGLSSLVALTSATFRNKKRSLNALDFDDLLLGARSLLRDFEDVRRHYQENFRAVLVDEFQDTDEVQAEIVEWLARDPLGKRRFAERKLMIVGDPKQSIYRFRRARVTVFFRMLNAVLQDGGVLEHLQENRRSAPPIAEFANRLCESMMTGLGKEPVSEEVDISYRIRFSEDDRLLPKADVPFLGMTYVAADADTRAATGREMEAEALARLLQKWKTSGGIESWKEVAFLFRTTTNMGLYIDALQRHEIPVFVVQGTYFYRKTEVSDLIALLELILHPADPMLRATVLSSSLAGLPFDDLLSGKTSDRLDEILRPWIELRDRATAAEILEDVIRKTDFDVVMMGQPNGSQRIANIGKLIEVTREMARQGITALDETVHHLRERADDMGAREAEAQISGENDDAVRVLTVHQAKGLEFDIVVIPDLAAKTARSTGDRTFLSDRWGILAGASYGLHRKPLPHALILTTKKEEEDQQYEEEKRLLYVAITRARKMLVMGEGFSKHGGPWLQWVQKVLEQFQPGSLDRVRDGQNIKIRTKLFTMDIVPASLLNIPEQLPLPADTMMIGRDVVVAQYQALLQNDFQPPVFEVELTSSDLLRLSIRTADSKQLHRELAWATKPADLGIEAHRILQSGMRPSPDELRHRSLTDLQKVFDSAEWQALEAALPERELPFMLYQKISNLDCWIRGRIDALVPSDVPRIIDYKYRIWRPGDEDAYKIQLAVYSLAAMRTLGVPDAIGELWFLRPPMQIVRLEMTQAQAERQVRRAIESLLAQRSTLAKVDGS